MATDDLVVWLRGVLDEEEAAAERLRQQAQEVRQELKDPALLGKPMPGWGLWPKVERMAPGVLTDIMAKRGILAEVDLVATEHRPDDSDSVARCAQMEYVLRLFAAAYADRPGYREEWRP